MKKLLDLLLMSPEADTMDGMASSSPSLNGPGAGGILIVDDIPANLDLLAGILEGAGYLVRPTISPAFALQSARATPPDLILLDIRMPDMDGYEVCRLLKDDPLTRDVPVVFISALDDAEDKVRAFATGGVDYITKPFESAEVLARVRTHLTLARMQRHLELLVSERTTQLREKTQDLEEAQACYRTVADFTHDWEYWQAPDGSFRYISPSCQRISGHAPQDFLADPDLLHRIVVPEDLPVWEQHFHEEGREGLPLREIQFRIRRPDGTVVWIEHVCRPVLDGAGAFLGFRASNRDISGRKELERELRQAQKLEAIGTLAGGIAHDFNNILGAIFGYAEMTMEDGTLSPRLKDYLANILTAAQRAKELVQQILTFCRKAEKDLQPLQAALIVKEAMKLLRSSLPASITIRQNIIAMDKVLADPSQIHQVVMNLCTNAYHAMRDAGGTLAVSLRRVTLDPEDLPPGEGSMPGDYLQLEVSDSGVGMDRAILEKIFEPYFTTKKEGEGTGLGLAVVHGIVKGYRGFIRVLSAPGQGSTFKVHLPVHAAPDQERPAGAAGGGTTPPTGTERILAVDDEGQLLDLYRRVLEPAGYTVFTLRDSVQAWEIFRWAPDHFDLVITDMTMPGKSGLELARQVRAVRADCPVILATGHSDRLDREEALAAGFAEYLQKPVRRRELLGAVRAVLDRKTSISAETPGDSGPPCTEGSRTAVP
ncbi:MAG: response regulator [Thermodesulfobacteriota bacterium]